jgi:hypothetical protein
MTETVEPPKSEEYLPGDFTLTVLPFHAVEDMVHKIVQAASSVDAAAAVAAWRNQHGQERWADIGHHHVVVGRDLMYLHDAPDGTLVPHLRRPDGSEELFTDAAHADALF